MPLTHLVLLNVWADLLKGFPCSHITRGHTHTHTHTIELAWEDGRLLALLPGVIILTKVENNL